MAAIVRPRLDASILHLKCSAGGMTTVSFFGRAGFMDRQKYSTYGRSVNSEEKKSGFYFNSACSSKTDYGRKDYPGLMGNCSLTDTDCFYKVKLAILLHPR